MKTPIKKFSIYDIHELYHNAADNPESIPYKIRLSPHVDAIASIRVDMTADGMQSIEMKLILVLQIVSEAFSSLMTFPSFLQNYDETFSNKPLQREITVAMCMSCIVCDITEYGIHTLIDDVFIDRESNIKRTIEDMLQKMEDERVYLGYGAKLDVIPDWIAEDAPISDGMYHGNLTAGDLNTHRNIFSVATQSLADKVNISTDELRQFFDQHSKG